MSVTEGDLRRRSDQIGLVAVLLGAMSTMLPWWAWRRRRAVRFEADKLMVVAQDIKSSLDRVAS